MLDHPWFALLVVLGIARMMDWALKALVHHPPTNAPPLNPTPDLTPNQNPKPLRQDWLRLERRRKR